mmetsp:Transcript_130767/g.279719  ORF Transcript_130767/g.279719 Transcript_130767/m.279719 type:complete len:242 (+) Transcript_130767:213-938(+)
MPSHGLEHEAAVTSQLRGREAESLWILLERLGHKLDVIADFAVTVSERHPILLYGLKQYVPFLEDRPASVLQGRGILLHSPQYEIPILSQLRGCELQRPPILLQGLEHEFSVATQCLRGKLQGGPVSGDDLEHEPLLRPLFLGHRPDRAGTPLHGFLGRCGPIAIDLQLDEFDCLPLIEAVQSPPVCPGGHRQDVLVLLKLLRSVVQGLPRARHCLQHEAAIPEQILVCTFQCLPVRTDGL